MNLGDYSLISNSLSFGVATFGAATAFFWLSRSQVTSHYKTALTISGVVTLVALYHYFRMFESFGAAFSVVKGKVEATGLPFNDAYRYVDWLLTVPLLLIELILVMGLSRSETVSKATSLSIAAAVMILLGYPGEIAADASTRWVWWALSMCPFLYIVFTLFTSLGESIQRQPEAARGLILLARNTIVVTWAFYPIVFLLPMIGLATAGTVSAPVQVGYTVADVLAKAGFGVMIFLIARAKSDAEAENAAA